MIILNIRFYCLCLIMFLFIMNNDGYGLDMYDLYHLCKNNSPTLKLQNQTLKRKEGVLQSVKGYFDWTFTNQSSAGRSYRQPSEQEKMLSDGSVGDVRSSLYSTSLGVLKPFKSGTIVNPTIGFNKSDAGLPHLDPMYNFDIGISFIQSLSRLKNSKNYSNQKAAELDYKSEKLVTEHLLSYQVYSVLVAYMDYNAAHNKHQIYSASLQKSNQFFLEMLELIDADFRPKSDINQLEADLAEKEISLIYSEQMIIEYKRALCQILGIGFDEFGQSDTINNILPNDRHYMGVISTSNEKLISIAMNKRKDIQAASLVIQSSEVLLESARRDLFPEFSLEGQYRIKGSEFGSSFAKTIRNDDSHVKDMGIILNLSLPFSDDVDRGKYRQSLSMKDQARINYENQSNSIKLDVITARKNLIAANKSLEQIEKATDRYITVLENEKARFTEGLITLTELLLLQDRLILAELKLVELNSEYIKSIIRFRYQLGILIPERKFSRESLNEYFVSLPSFN